MPVITKVKILAIRCDKPKCTEVLRVPFAQQDMAEYEDAFRRFLGSHRWSIWVGRGRRFYCPDHGPSEGSKMRQVSR